MRRWLLTTAAVAALGFGMPAYAQQAQDAGRDRTPAAGASQPAQAGDQGERATPRQGRGANQAQGETQRGNQTGAGGDSRQSGAAGTRARDGDAAQGQTEQRRSSEQAGGRSGEQRRDARDRNQRDEARDGQRDRSDQERSRTTRDRDGDRNRDRADQDRGRDRDRADRDRGRDRDRADRERDRGDRDRADRDRADRNRANRDRDQADRGRDRDRDRADRDRGQDRDRADRRDSRRDFSFSEEQRTRISARFSDRIDRLNVRPISRSRISVSVGVVVPSSIRLYEVPAEIVEIYPAFRGHRFVVVEDEIVIIEPRTRRIVTTISRDGGSRAVSRSSTTTGTAAAGARVRFRPEQRETIRTIVMREAECRHELRFDFRIGIPLPRTVEICEFPDEVFAAVPEARQYRYMIRGDDIVIVDPDGHRIVEVID